MNIENVAKWIIILVQLKIKYNSNKTYISLSIGYKLCEDIRKI